MEDVSFCDKRDLNPEGLPYMSLQDNEEDAAGQVPRGFKTREPRPRWLRKHGPNLTVIKVISGEVVSLANGSDRLWNELKQHE